MRFLLAGKRKNGNSVDFCRFYVYTFPYILIRKELPWTTAKISKKKKARPENEIKPEVKSFNDEIEQKAAEMQAQHGDKFNAERFKSAAREYAEKNGNLNGISADNFVEKTKKT